MDMKNFEKGLTRLINRHSIENVADMPDYLLAEMICRMIEAIGPSVKNTLDWHGCDSVCHPSPGSMLEEAIKRRRRMKHETEESWRASGYMIMDQCGRYIGRTFRVPPPHNYIVNANLMATAPELLEDLESRYAQTRCGCGHPACNRCEDDRVTERVLRKAKGGGE